MDSISASYKITTAKDCADRDRDVSRGDAAEGDLVQHECEREKVISADEGDLHVLTTVVIFSS
jgi:hypothetical protein